MTDIKFYVNNELIDYFFREDFSIKINKKIIDNEEPTSRTGAHTLTIKIPLTANNKVIFKHIDEQASIDKFNTTLKYNAIIYAGDIIIIKGILYIRDINIEENVMSCYIISEDIGWAKLIENKSLKDITPALLNKKVYKNNYNEFRGFDTIVDEIEYYHTSNQDEYYLKSDIVFPLCAYRNFYVVNLYNNTKYISNQTFSTLNVSGEVTLPDAWKIPNSDETLFINNNLTQPHLSYYDMPPAVYVGNVVRAIFADAGYSVGGNFFNKKNVNKLILPYVGDNPPPFNYNFLSNIKLISNDKIYIQNQSISEDFGNAGEYSLPVLPDILPCYNNIIPTVFDNNIKNIYYTQKITDPILFPGFGNDKFNIWDVHIFDLFRYYSNFEINKVPLLNYSFGFLPKTGVYYPPTDGTYSFNISFNFDIFSKIYFKYIDINPPHNILVNANKYFKYTIAIVRGDIDENIINNNIINRDDILDIENFRYSIKNNGSVVYKQHFLIEYDPDVDLCYSKSAIENLNIEIELERNEGYKVILIYAPIYGVYTEVLNAGVPFPTQYQRNILLNSINIDIKCISSDDDLIIPKFLPEISQLDFIKDLIVLFNLRFDVDNEKKIIFFDTFNEFFLPTSSSINLNEKTDNTNIKISPISELSNIKCLYVDDREDYLNEHRKEGDETTVIKFDRYLDIIKNVNDIIIKNEIFAPTSYQTFNIIRNTEDGTNILLDDSNTPSNNMSLFYRPNIFINDSIYIPFFVSEEGYYTAQNNDKSIKYNYAPRLIVLKNTIELNDVLNGLRWDINTNATTFVSTNKHINTYFNDYQLNENINDITNLSWDGDFGLYNTFYKKQIEETKRSHQIEVAVYLTAEVFKELSTKKPILINGIHYRLTEIVDYDSVLDTLTTLKLNRII